ncbi:CoA transferase [Novosphingobium sp. Gsoil 351]|nr:CoA transferase [Novosphingobium sp. Gsoil 351]
MLTGVRVLDLTTVVFGPYATQILHDLGAEVLKIEAPESGDIARWLGAPAKTPGMSPTFFALNGGKRSAVLNLKDADDLAAMHRLVGECDVLVLNVRGKALERLGLDFASARALNPGIIYVHCVGFGQSGPYANEPAYDDVIQAATGFASLPARVDGDPRARYVPSLIADKVSGLHAAYAALAAIVHKLRTGEGQYVEVPMFEAFAQFSLVEHLAGLTYDPPNAPACYARQIDPNRQPFPTSDGYISIVPYTEQAWPRLLEALGAGDAITDPRFATREKRVANVTHLYALLATLTVNHTSAELEALCRTLDLPARTARDIGDIHDDPHLAATGFFARREHPSEGAYWEMKQPVEFGGWPARERGPPPKLGEHPPAFSPHEE